MKTILIILGVILVLVVGYLLINNEPAEVANTLNNNNATTTAQGGSRNNEGDEIVVMPIEHATAVLEWDGGVVYTDPVGEETMFEGQPEPHLILVTDIHGDHLSTTTLERVMGSSTQIIAPQAVADLLSSSMLERTTVLANGSTTTAHGFSIEAVAMYNLPEGDDSRHTKGRGNGYVIERDGTRVYIAGDTDDTPEMRGLENINIAFIPMNPPFTMDVETAADAVLEFKPETVYPYHYRGQDGLSDVARFRQLVNAGDPNIEVILLDWYQNETPQ